MVKESDLNEAIVLDQKEDDMLKVPGGGMEEQLHRGKFVFLQYKSVVCRAFFCPMPM